MARETATTASRPNEGFTRTLRLFISSVQKEFATERAALAAYLRGDPLLRRFFEAFVFEEVPAADRRADEVYLDEVQRCDVYVGLFGREYGPEDAEGVSPTEREFDVATRRRKHRLVFVKGADDRGRHPKMQALIRKAGNQLVRRRFGTTAELISAVYASLVDYLAAKELVRTGPFDTMVCRDATHDDLSEDKILQFVRARPGTLGAFRCLPLNMQSAAGWSTESSSPRTIMKYLKLPYSMAPEVVKRPPELSGDTASSEVALLHVVDWLADQEKYEPDIVVFLQCTSRIRNESDIDNAITVLLENNADSLFSACRFNKYIWQVRNGEVSPINYDYRRRWREQDFPHQVLENGSIYVFKTSILKELGSRLGGKIVVYELLERRLTDFYNQFKTNT